MVRFLDGYAQVDRTFFVRLNVDETRTIARRWAGGVIEPKTVKVGDERVDLRRVNKRQDPVEMHAVVRRLNAAI
jgi:hypothetical protein